MFKFARKVCQSYGLGLVLLAASSTACLDQADPDQDLDFSEEVSELALPAPTNLTAVAVSTTGIDLAWDPSPGATRYIVMRGTAPGNETTLTSMSADNAIYKARALAPDTQYCWQVRNLNAQNQASGRSNEVCVSTLATSPTLAPTNVLATAISSTRIELSWDAVPGAIVYYVYQAVAAGPFNYVTSYAPPTTRHVAAGLTPNTQYSYYVIARTAAGNSPPSMISTATTFVDSLEGYYRFDEKTGTTTVDSSGYGRNGNLVGASYSLDRPNVRRQTNMSSVKFTTSPSSVVALPYNTATRFTRDFAISTWIKPAAGATQFKAIGMRDAGCGLIGWELAQDATNGLNFADRGGVYSFGASLPSDLWSHVAVSVDSNVMSLYVDGELVTTAAYVASARPTVGISIGHVGGCPGDAITVDETRLVSGPLSAADVAALGKLPPAPANLVVTSTSSRSQTLTWNAVAGAGQYFINKGTASGNQQYLTSVSGAATSYNTGAHLDIQTQYSWFVVAEVGELFSTPSNEQVVTTLPPPSAPVVTSTTISANRVKLDWAAVSGSARYFVYQSINGAAFTRRATVLSPAVTYQAASLAAASTYIFKVSAVDTGLVEGAASNEITFVVP